MHFGARDRETDRADEAALIRCLRAQREAAGERGDAVDHLYLVGDVFDGYLEYRHLVPKGCVRFQALLAEWVDDGVPVTYLVGNHDPWHGDYFEAELGVRVADTVDARHYGLGVHLEHGDAVGSTHGLYPALRPWMRHPVPVWLYRTLLPADLGIGLARWVSDAMRDHDPDPDLVAALDAYARRLLAPDAPEDAPRDSPAADLVVMGHTHVPTLTVPALDDAARKAYLNTGNWFDARSFGRLDDRGIHLMRWNGTRAVSIEATTLPVG
jgi:UDP-2,3-diacylglucosamine hydrolase